MKTTKYTVHINGSANNAAKTSPKPAPHPTRRYNSKQYHDYIVYKFPNKYVNKCKF